MLRRVYKTSFDGNDEDEVEHADEDIHGFQPYLPNPGQAAGAGMTHTADCQRMLTLLSFKH